jgi:hypothetical protein
MKHLVETLDRMALRVLSVGLAALFVGMLSIGAGVLVTHGQTASAGMAIAGAGALTSLLCAFWVMRRD